MSTSVTEKRTPTGYLTEAEVAAMIEVHPNTLARWRRAGYSPKYHRIGFGRNARIRYRAADVKYWIRSVADAEAAEGVA